MGRLSSAPGDDVQVPYGYPHCKLVVHWAAVVASSAVHDASQPPSVPPFTPPPRRCVCFPAPVDGAHPPTTAATNGRKRPTVTSYLSSRKLLILAGAEESVN